MNLHKHVEVEKLSKPAAESEGVNAKTKEILQEEEVANKKRGPKAARK